MWVTWGHFTDSSKVPVVAFVAVWTLHEDGVFTHAFGEHLAAHVVEVHTTTCNTDAYSYQVDKQSVNNYHCIAVCTCKYVHVIVKAHANVGYRNYPK